MHANTSLTRGGGGSNAPGGPAEDRIFIPLAERGQPISSIPISVRLKNVLEKRDIRILGDLNGLNYENIVKYNNCGQKTVAELQSVVRKLQEGTIANTQSSGAVDSVNSPFFVVPREARHFHLSDLPLSVRLERVLRRHGHHKLGDIDRVEVSHLLRWQGCGKKCIKELQEVIKRAASGEFTPVDSADCSSALKQVAASIDFGLARLARRDRAIFESRICGNNGSPRTLEDVAQEFGITQERVRQITKKNFQVMRRSGGLKLKSALQTLVRECEQHVCPLTPDLFTKWIGPSASCRHDAHFYVRVLDTLEASVPAWPGGPTRECGDDAEFLNIEKAVELWLRKTGIQPTASETYSYLRQQRGFKKLSVGAFLAAIRIAKRFIVDFPEPDRPQLRLRRLRIADFARPILEASDIPLTPEKIIERAKALYGHNVILNTGRSAGNVLLCEEGIYLLGPRALGTRKHLKTPIKAWPAVRNAFAKTLKTQNRPISTTEAVDLPEIADFNIRNAHEMAVILREDKRFVDLGRHLFGLAKWGIQERERVKDLLPRVFEQANRVLRIEQALEKLTRLRSVSPGSIANCLKNHPEIHSFGFGYYGLKNWGNEKRSVIVADRKTVELAIRRGPQPISFQALCQTFSVDVSGNQADLLWKSCARSTKLRRAPDKQAPDTLLLHKSVSLEQSLANVSRDLKRPMAAYELEWELRSRYGDLFASIGLKEIEQKLAKSDWFLRDSAGQFFLDEDFNNEDFNPQAIRAAVTNSLIESMDIAGCDELIERLELSGFQVDDLSQDMLASILRGAVGLQEVANQRFRARQ